MKGKIVEAIRITLLATIVTFVMVAVAITMESNRDVPRVDIEAAIASYEPDNPRFNYDCQDLICNVDTASIEYIVDCREGECVVTNYSEGMH